MDCGRTCHIFRHSFRTWLQIAEVVRALDIVEFKLTRKKLLEKVDYYVKINNFNTRFRDGVPGLDWFTAFCKKHWLSIKNLRQLKLP